jgi:ATP-dependent Lon protease
MSVANTSAGLVGSDKAYDGSHVGLVFDLLACGTSASPLIVLDELDKSAGDDRFPVDGALYGLLEPRTAKCYRDQSIPEIELDARHVLWIATSNRAKCIPEPIRSRMRAFSISRPSAAAAREIVLHMYRSTGSELMPGIELPDLEHSVIALLAPHPPRTIQLSLREAFGRAAYEGRRALVVRDIPAIDSGPRKVGFV